MEIYLAPRRTNGITIRCLLPHIALRAPHSKGLFHQFFNLLFQHETTLKTHSTKTFRFSLFRGLALHVLVGSRGPIYRPISLYLSHTHTQTRGAPIRGRETRCEWRVARTLVSPFHKLCRRTPIKARNSRWTRVVQGASPELGAIPS